MFRIAYGFENFKRPATIAGDIDNANAKTRVGKFFLDLIRRYNQLES